MDLLLGLMTSGAIYVFAWWVIRSALKVRKPKAKPIAQQDLYSIGARQKALKERSAANKAERDEWNSTYRRLIEATCTHEYYMHAQRWWVCTKCFYEKPWYYRDGCSCVVHRFQVYVNANYQYRLQHRSGTCNIHGRDYEQYKKEAAAEYEKTLETRLKMYKAMHELEKFSKGGITN